MQKFCGPSFGMSVSAIIAISCVGMLGMPTLRVLADLVQDPRSYLLLAILAACALGSYYGGMPRKLPNYAGRPPLASLMAHLKGPAILVVSAVVLLVAQFSLHGTAVAVGQFAVWALYSAAGLTLGLAVASIGVAAKLVRRYRQECEWEDQLHPQQRGC
jgi:TctA family transporter